MKADVNLAWKAATPHFLSFGLRGMDSTKIFGTNVSYGLTQEEFRDKQCDAISGSVSASTLQAMFGQGFYFFASYSQHFAQTIHLANDKTCVKPRMSQTSCSATNFGDRGGWGSPYGQTRLANP